MHGDAEREVAAGLQHGGLHGEERCHDAVHGVESREEAGELGVVSTDLPSSAATELPSSPGEALAGGAGRRGGEDGACWTRRAGEGIFCWWPIDVDFFFSLGGGSSVNMCNSGTTLAGRTKFFGQKPSSLYY